MLAISGHDHRVEVLGFPDLVPLISPQGRFHKHFFDGSGNLIAAFAHTYARDGRERVPGKHRSPMLHNLRSFRTASWEFHDMQPSPRCGDVWDMVQSPDGEWIAAGLGLGEVIVVRHAASGEVAHTLTGHTDCVRCVRFSADSNYLASASYDGTVTVGCGAPGLGMSVHEFRTRRRIMGEASWLRCPTSRSLSRRMAS